jgi:hypothetical protein
LAHRNAGNVVLEGDAAAADNADSDFAHGSKGREYARQMNEDK